MHQPLKLSSPKTYAAITNIDHSTNSQPVSIPYSPIPFKGLIRRIMRWKVFLLACITLKSPRKIIEGFRKIMVVRNNIWAGDLKKMYRVGNKYYYNQYIPGWPSKGYDRLVKSELRRYAAPHQHAGEMLFVFMAITSKCPLRCEHCFEWDNLNQRESFTKEELFKTVALYQEQGVFQFHFSGGEPMVRFADLVDLIKFTSKKSECWVLTSGFNVTAENARILKAAGCTGMAVSIDHYIPEMHDGFRGKKGSFSDAVNAVRNAREAGLVLALSVCATREFIDGGHLIQYMDFARNLGVHYVQVLEPKNVGRYAGKEVLLEAKHIDELESIFKQVNHSAEYRNYPTMIYHGYHQRRIGCFSGSRSFYIDSVGNVHSCPFCHTHSYNVLDIIRRKENKIPTKENTCERYEMMV